MKPYKVYKSRAAKWCLCTRHPDGYCVSIQTFNTFEELLKYYNYIVKDELH